MSFQISGPMLFFGGPYSNCEALQAMHKVAEEKQIPADHCLCSGDVVAYCGDPGLCVDFMRDWGCQVVKGNCEESLGNEAQDCGCGFEEGTSCYVLSQQWFAYANSHLNDDQRAWMRNLPEMTKLQYQSLNLLAVHGGLEQTNKFVFASQEDIIADELALTNADIVLAGHCGIPFGKHISGKLWVNSGVIGMPANDGQAHTWYCLVQPQENGLEFSFHKLDYDHKVTAKKMQEKGLSSAYGDALVSGLWPGLNVLPEKEKSETGKNLASPSLFMSFSR